MPRVQRRAGYQQLSDTERDRILELRDIGLSLRTIATRVGRNVSTVQRCVSQWLQEHQRTRRRGRGAPRRTSARMDRHIRRVAVTDPFATASEIRGRLPHTGRSTVSTQTIRRRLHDVGLRARCPVTCIPLRPRHHTERLAWCRARQHWGREWRHILFSDETRFCLGRNDGRRMVWRQRHQRNAQAFIRERHRGPTPGVMVWGGIMYGRRTPLVDIPQTLTAQRYVDLVVEPVLRPFLHSVPGTAFQQDNARPHVARVTAHSLHGLDVLPWPAASPDLSPVEHIWDVIGRQLQRAPPPANLNVLRAQVSAAWNNIPQTTIDNLVDSMPRRIAACIAAHGAHTRY